MHRQRPLTTNESLRREDVELVETHERHVAELEAALAEVRATAAAAEAEDEAAQQAAVDRLNEHDSEVRERVWGKLNSKIQQPTAPAVLLPLHDCSPRVLMLPARLRMTEMHVRASVVQEYHVMKILLGNKLEAMEQQFEDIHKVREQHAGPVSIPTRGSTSKNIML